MERGVSRSSRCAGRDAVAGAARLTKRGAPDGPSASRPEWRAPSTQLSGSSPPGTGAGCVVCNDLNPSVLGSCEGGVRKAHPSGGPRASRKPPRAERRINRRNRSLSSCAFLPQRTCTRGCGCSGIRRSARPLLRGWKWKRRRAIPRSIKEQGGFRASGILKIWTDEVRKALQQIQLSSPPTGLASRAR
jgi:hypothetical protein